MDSNNVFSARKKINSILEKLGGEKVSFEDVENAILKLSKFDTRHVLDILLKRLEGSNNEFFVANYILRELGDETIIEPVLNMIFQTDVSDDKKAVLISLLDEMNVDLAGLDLKTAFKDINSVGRMAVESLLHELENDYVTLDKAVEWLYDVPGEARYSFIDAIIETEHEKGFEFIQKLIGSDDKELVMHILQSLSRLSNSNALSIIKEYLPYINDSEVLDFAERTIRKLTFKGVQEAGKKKKISRIKPGEFYKAMVTNIDGVGSQSLWIARFFGKKLDCMFLLLNENVGIKDCFGNKMTKKQFDDMIAHQFDEGIIIKDISFDKAVKLINDALFINKKSNNLIAPAFHFLRGNILKDVDLSPESYKPDFKSYNLKKIEADNKLLELTQLILSSIPECESWFVINNYIYDVAEELLARKNMQQIVKPTKKKLKEVIDKCLKNEIPNFKRRLLLTADLLNNKAALKADSDISDHIQLLLCAALTLDKKTEEHPFLMAIADDSVYQAEITLLNGIDFRKNPEYFS